ncbi:MAG: PASTA domain-containing protein [Ruminococcus sp.]|nr:PASTA domain-containing protein [Ruminococcus sp.]
MAMLLTVFCPFYPFEKDLIFALALSAAAALISGAAAFAGNGADVKKRKGTALGIVTAVCIGISAVSGGMLKESFDSPKPRPYNVKEGVYPQELPSLEGMDYKTAKAGYAPYFNMTAEYYVWSEYPAGAITGQSPKAGSLIYMGNSAGDADVVRCTVSRGKQTVSVPNVVGMDVETACEIMEAVGLVPEMSGEYPENGGERVTGSYPAHNEEAELHSTVTLYIGREELQ